MILMSMRLQKTQLSNSLKWTSGSTTFKRDPYIMAGYTDFDVLVVGAAGGRSGQMTHNYNDQYLGPQTDRYRPSGGGGGSSKRVMGSLSDLAVEMAITVGAAGSTGADKTVSTYNSASGAGTGGRGGNSSFGSVAVGYGGFGGLSGYTNNFGNGVPPTGGAGAKPDGSAGPVGGISSQIDTNPGVGTWDGTQGSGGGGGGGAWTADQYAAQAGGTGANAGGYASPGESVQSSVYGGGGGGCNVAPFTGGTAEYYGSGWSNASKRGGVVLLKLS